MQWKIAILAMKRSYEIYSDFMLNAHAMAYYYEMLNFRLWLQVSLYVVFCVCAVFMSARRVKLRTLSSSSSKLQSKLPYSFMLVKVFLEWFQVDRIANTQWKELNQWLPSIAQALNKPYTNRINNKHLSGKYCRPAKWELNEKVGERERERKKRSCRIAHVISWCLPSTAPNYMKSQSANDTFCSMLRSQLHLPHKRSPRVFYAIFMSKYRKFH